MCIPYNTRNFEKNLLNNQVMLVFDITRFKSEGRPPIILHTLSLSRCKQKISGGPKTAFSGSIL